MTASIAALFKAGIDLRTFKQLEGKSKIRQELGWDDKKVLIMNRNLHSIYGIEYFLEALPAVLEEKPDTGVIIVGDGPLRAEYEAKVEGTGLKSRVHFAGFVDKGLMAEYLQAADVYVTTSLSDGSSCAMLEAMACGLPVTCSDIPTFSEFAGEAALFFNQQDPVDMAQKIRTLYENHSLYNTYRQKGLERAKQFSWRRTAQQVVELYHDILTAQDIPSK